MSGTVHEPMHKIVHCAPVTCTPQNTQLQNMKDINLSAGTIRIKQNPRTIISTTTCTQGPTSEVEAGVPVFQD